MHRLDEEMLSTSRVDFSRRGQNHTVVAAFGATLHGALTAEGSPEARRVRGAVAVDPRPA